MKNGLRIFDADAHVVEPKDLWERFLDKKYQHRVSWQQPFAGMDRFRPATVDGRYTQSRKTLYGRQQEAVRWTTEEMVAKYGDVVLKGFDGESVADAMRVEGVDIAVIYGPGYDMWVDGIDPDLQAAMARAYNRWGAEMRDTSGGMILTSAPVPLNDITRAVAEVKYAYEELGVRCFWGRPNPFNHRTLGDRYFDPLWEILQDYDVPFATHEFMGLNGPSAGEDRFESFVEWHTCVHPMEAQMAMLAMIVNGVYERFPKLRVAYMEAGSAWVPSWLHRIEEHVELAGWLETPECTKSPLDYFKTNCWVTTECDEHLVYHTIEELGDNRILFETDFPHPDSKYPKAVEIFLSQTRISDEAKQKILWDNAVDFYRFPDDMMPSDV
ncbi:MAG: putative TIM-barrel fold metal-dependent hydrolase [Myxococcota bacterium]|jgi:predicted TIM-barrel fold metal-dependent hydrolase